MELKQQVAMANCLQNSFETHLFNGYREGATFVVFFSFLARTTIRIRLKCFYREILESPRSLNRKEKLLQHSSFSL